MIVIKSFYLKKLIGIFHWVLPGIENAEYFNEIILNPIIQPIMFCQQDTSNIYDFCEAIPVNGYLAKTFSLD